MRYLLALLWLLFFVPIGMFGQVSVEPGSIEFGDVGTSIVNMTYWKKVTLYNTSTDTLELRSSLPPKLDWNVGDSDHDLSILSTRGFGPGDSAYLTISFQLYGWGPKPTFELYDTAWIAVRVKGDSASSETLTPVPVHINVVETQQPMLSTEKGLFEQGCRCFIPMDQEPGSSIATLRVFIVNSLNSSGIDTLWIDSLLITPLGDNGIDEKWFGNIATFDTIAPYDYLNGKFPKGHTGEAPQWILPHMRANFLVGLPRWKPGNKRTEVTAHVRRSRDGMRWALTDTLQAFLGVVEEPVVGTSTTRDPIYMRAEQDVTTQDGFGMNKCGIPDETPLFVDTVYISGPRREAIDLVKRTGTDSVPKLPARLECFNSNIGYNMEVHRARTAPGTTVDTIVAEYHYDDPDQGRVDGVSKRPLTIIIDPDTSMSVPVQNEAGPTGALTVIPNPATDRIRLEWRSFGFSEAVGVRLFDALGRDVLRRVVPLTLSGVADVDVSELPAGTYRAVVEGVERDVLAFRSVVIVR